MDSRRHHDDLGGTDAAFDFVRFCHRRRRVGWPELYDEMCRVASRGLYHGWGFGELAEHGIAFGLAEMPRLAGLVSVMAPVPIRSDLMEETPEEPLRASAFIGAAR